VALLFSESQGRAVVSCNPDHRDAIIRLANDAGVPAMRIGHTAFGTFVIERNQVPIIHITAPELERIWSSAFGLLLAGDSIDDVIRDRGEEVELIRH
jgi:hypothetical protein